MGVVRHTVRGIRFEWDDAKAAANLRKHGVAFELGCEAFFDPFLRVVEAGVQGGEERHAVVGMTIHWRLLHVVFVERREAIRIISARRATAAQRRRYEDQ